MLPEFLARLFPRKKSEKRVLIVGLDAAGKTTFLYRLHLGEIVTTIPTIGRSPALCAYPIITLRFVRIQRRKRSSTYI